jgi:predicted HD phosphohydrolase
LGICAKDYSPELENFNNYSMARIIAALTMDACDTPWEKHFRKELREKAGEAIERVLRELAPRLNPWYPSTVNALKDIDPIQTDLLRYRSQGTDFAIDADVLREDIDRLRTPKSFIRQPYASDSMRVALSSTARKAARCAFEIPAIP